MIIKLKGYKIRSIYFSFYFVLLINTNFLYKPPDSLWTKTYGGSENDRCHSIHQTTDIGYIMAGYTESFGEGKEDVYLIKTDSAGDTIWSRTFGGDKEDFGLSVQQIKDGGYIISGATQSLETGSYDVYLIKTDIIGDTTWTKTYGGDNYDCGYSVQQTSDGGYIIAGWTGSYGSGLEDVYLIKTDSAGDTIWSRTFGGDRYDYGYSVKCTSDGGYIIAGQTQSFGEGGFDVYLIKTDSIGDTLWTRTYGGSNFEAGDVVQKTNDGGYIIVGNTYSFGAGDSDVYLIKTDSIGDSLWARTYGGNNYDCGYSVQQTSDGGYIVVGTTKSYGSGSEDVYLIKTDSVGNTIWSRTFGGIESDNGSDVKQTNDGGYIIVGNTYSFGQGKNDVYLIKIGSEVDILEDYTEEIFYISQSEPNPFNNTTRIIYELPYKCHVYIAVYNSIGGRIRTIFNKFQNRGTHIITWDGRDDSGDKIQSGLYFLRIEAGNYRGIRKLIFVK